MWLSEIMLQQTQVKTAAPYFERFVAALPTLRDLAAAPLDDVLALWSGLGYYARARNLHAAAKRCVELHDGDLPRDLDALTALPGIGRSTAAAIASQAWGERCAILDGNVKRVLSRYHGIDGYPGLPAVEKKLWALVEGHVERAQLSPPRMADYTQAQMDLARRCARAPTRPACCARCRTTASRRREGRVAELPTPKPGKTPPQKYAHVLWAEDGEGRILLQRRPPTGIWASLWTLPQADDEARRPRLVPAAPARRLRQRADAAADRPRLQPLQAATAAAALARHRAERRGSATMTTALGRTRGTGRARHPRADPQTAGSQRSGTR